MRSMDCRSDYTFSSSDGLRRIDARHCIRQQGDLDNVAARFDESGPSGSKLFGRMHSPGRRDLVDMQDADPLSKTGVANPDVAALCAHVRHHDPVAISFAERDAFQFERVRGLRLDDLSSGELAYIGEHV